MKPDPSIRIRCSVWSADRARPPASPGADVSVRCRDRLLRSAHRGASNTGTSRIGPRYAGTPADGPSALSPPSQATVRVVDLDDFGRRRAGGGAVHLAASHPLWRERRRMIAMRPMLSTFGSPGACAIRLLTALLAVALLLGGCADAPGPAGPGHRAGRARPPMPSSCRTARGCPTGPGCRTGKPWAVVLALHGMNDSRDAWEYPGPDSPPHGVAVFAPDQRGFGDTDGARLLAGHAGAGGRCARHGAAAAPALSAHAS